MIDPKTSRCGLCLVSPPDGDPAALEAALAGGDIACVIIRAEAGDPDDAQRAAAALVPVIQAAGAAALVHNDTRVLGRTGADGVHVDSGIADIAAATTKLRPKAIVGAGGLRSRHDAMLAGEADPDYLFFGRLDGDTAANPYPKALALAEWCSSIMTIPAVVMGGSAVGSVRQAAEAGIEFVALSRAVWGHSQGPRAAVAEATALLAESEVSAT